MRQLEDSIDEFELQQSIEFEQNREEGLKARKYLFGEATTRSKPGPLRIHFDYSYWETDGTDGTEEGTIEWARNLLRHEALPRAAAEIGKLLTVRAPREGNLFLDLRCKRWRDGLCEEWNMDESNPGNCYKANGVWHTDQYLPPRSVCVDGACVDLPGGGGVDADTVIYVVANDKHCSGELAHALPCGYDVTTGRPTFGVVVFCPSKIANTAYGTVPLMLRATIHEIAHTLFFGSAFQKRYVHDDGSKMAWEEMYGSPVEGVTTMRPPRLLQAISEFSDCPNPDPEWGIPLENRYGSRTPSHWDMSHMKSDILNPGLYKTGRNLFSVFDMAIAESSGWYYGNWDNVGHTLHGYKAGCDFFSSNCTEYMAAHPDQRFFCPDDKQKQNMCSHERKFYGSCGKHDSFHPGCNVLYQETSIQVDGIKYATNCYDPANSPANGWKGHFFGAHSRCMEPVGSVSTPDGQSSTDPLCVKMSCTSAGLLRLEIEGVQLDCPSGEDVDVSGLPGWSGTLGPCPDNALVCSTLSCPNDCGSNGECVDGQCRCFPGYVGDECEKEICYDSPESSCEGTCILEKGICSDDTGPTRCCQDLMENYDFKDRFGSNQICSASRWPGQSCMKTSTYAEADRACRDIGARLCSLQELENKEARGTGCQLDGKQIWTSTKCSNGQGHMTGLGKHGREPACRTDDTVTAGVRCCAEAC